MEDCIFCKIVRGEIPCAKVWEDENYLAFADIYPVKPGHTLILPKKHIPYIFDMERSLLCGLIEACKPIAAAIKKAYQPKTNRIGIMVAGDAIPHVHIHLIPMDTGKDLNFANSNENAPISESQQTAQKIKEALE